MQRKVSKKKPSRQSTQVAESSPLISAAKEIVNTFQSPVRFIEFMSEALWFNWWARSESKQTDKTDDPFIVVNNFFRYVSCAWVKGGEDAIEEIARAVEDTADEWEGRTVQTDFYNIFASWALYSANSGCSKPSEDVAKLLALVHVGQCIRVHQYPNLKSNLA